MKHLLDMVPLAAMLVAFLVTRDLYSATIALMISLPVTALYYRARTKEWHLTHSFGALAALALGGLTLYFHQDAFIKAKPSLVYATMALAFLASQLYGEKVLVQRMLGGALALPDPVWRRINLAWATFYLACAVLNWYVATRFDDATWINFKTFGMGVLTVLFMAAQAPFVMRYAKEEPATGS